MVPSVYFIWYMNLFWLVLDSSFVNITNFTITKIRVSQINQVRASVIDLLLYWTGLLILLYLTLDDLCLCMALQTALKWLILLQPPCLAIDYNMCSSLSSFSYSHYAFTA